MALIASVFVYSPSTEVKVHNMLCFFMSTGDLNSGSHSCTENIASSSPQMTINIFNWLCLSNLKINAKWKKFPYLNKLLVVLR